MPSGRAYEPDQKVRAVEGLGTVGGVGSHAGLALALTLLSALLVRFTSLGAFLTSPPTVLLKRFTGQRR